jgi:hypothetical protein
MSEFKMIHHVDQRTIAAMYADYSPVFVLTAGRSGSKFVAELLNLSPGIDAYHEPRPALQYFSNFACHHQHLAETLTRMIDAARMEMVLATYITGKVFVESNQCLTFFAPALAGLFQNAKFVHLVRHPGEFAASAARKGWYVNDTIWEKGRPRPAAADSWNGWTLVRKLGWLWNANHCFLQDFLGGLEASRVLAIRLEDMAASVDHAADLFTFCGVGAPARERILERQATKVNRLWIDPQEPPNMRKDPNFPAYEDWTAAMRTELWEMVGATAAGFGYER